MDDEGGIGDMDDGLVVPGGNLDGGVSLAGGGSAD